MEGTVSERFRLLSIAAHWRLCASTRIQVIRGDAPCPYRTAMHWETYETFKDCAFIALDAAAHCPMPRLPADRPAQEVIGPYTVVGDRGLTVREIAQRAIRTTMAY